MVAIAAGCGRIDFTPLVDAGPQLVQTVSMTQTGTSPIAIPIVATAAGDLLIVATGNFSNAAAINSITDDAGNTYVSANALSTSSDAPMNIVEIFYAASSKAGATTLEIRSGGSMTRDVWFFEVAGMEQVDPLDVVATSNNALEPPNPAAPPVVPTQLPSLVVSTGDFVGESSGLDAVSSFTALPLQSGNDTAFMFAVAPGSYGAVWDDGNDGTYCASTVAFKVAH